MLELLLLRHGKSRWDVEGADDHDRDLAPRGEKAASAVGKLTSKKKWLPDLVLCSTAVRARHTLELAAKTWPDTIEIRFLKSLYLAAPWRFNEVVHRQAPTYQRMMLIGHNPGMHDFAVRLIGRGGKKDREKIEGKFPTGALVRIGFEIETWSDAVTGSGQLLNFIRPRDLK